MGLCHTYLPPSFPCGIAGAPLSADAWLAELRTSVPDKLREEEKEYQKAVKAGPKLKAGGHRPWPPCHDSPHVSVQSLGEGLLLTV